MESSTLYPLTPRQAGFVARARGLIPRFSARAAEHDAAGSFPFANIEDMRRAQLPRLVVPEEYGGWGASLLETILTVETLALGDGSTALALTMHLQTLGHVAETRSWPDAIFGEICGAAVEHGALVNYLGTEPELGSPSRGGKPQTTARPVPADDPRGSGWLLNGR
jgi:alkylation response protein AidB-like acyl-CoA dehydrogenase